MHTSHSFKIAPPPPFSNPGYAPAYNCILCRDNGMTGMAVAQHKYDTVRSPICDVPHFLKGRPKAELSFFDVIIVTW